MKHIEKSVTEHLYKAMSSPLKHFIESRVKNSSIADDILHEVFIKIHNRIDTLKDPAKVESWIFQITRNAIIDHFRKDKGHVDVVEEDLQESDDDEEDLHKQASAGLTERVYQLPDIYKQAILLTTYEGLSQKQLAEKMNISLTGAKSRVQRARKMLKDMLLECCHFDYDRYGTVIDFHKACCCCASGKKT
ncbi:MAG: RNA polymerase sigma factor SigZ [Cyclobacteriaceae bacterium]|nr:RNA polymerase sigma factor SigZ [Cyclobacteriaceae bacterium]